MVVPSALAAVMIGLPAGLVITASESLLVVMLFVLAEYDISVAAAGAAMSASWIVLGVTFTAQHTAQSAARWSEERYQAAQSVLEEARQQRAESARTVQDLANATRQLSLASSRMSMLRGIAEDAERTKTAFVASVSHELRTPLNMITGLVELMVDEPRIYDVLPSPKMRADLEIVYRNSKHLARMVDDVLDLTRLEAGHATLHREWVDLKEIVTDSVTVISPLIRKKGLSLEVTTADDVPGIHCDRTRVQQVIMNLLSNAARFTEAGSVELSVRRQNRHVLVSVTDTGPGIDPESLSRIFEPFYQGVGDVWRSKGGSGLGLSISEQFVRLHGGKMWAESQIGQGSSFFFTLPVSLPVEHAARPGHWAREDWIWREHTFRTEQAVAGGDLLRPRVVICDETGDLHGALTRYSDRIEFVDTRDLEQAAEELRERQPHAVLANTARPDALLAVVDRLVANARGTPVIGCCVPHSVEKAFAAGAQGYLVKPVAREELGRALDGLGVPVKRVLVVDDDPDASRLFSRMLSVSDDRLEVVTVASGEEALAELRHSPPDVVLLDIIMPGLDGWRVLETMRSEEYARNVPVFLLTAQDVASQPLMTKVFVAATRPGLSLGKLLRCTLELSSLLLKPDSALRPELA
jgi:signal transduction histidine kinase/CheY-like chemotaxis protein